MSVLPRELFAPRVTRRASWLAFGLCAGASVSYGCGSSNDDLFGKSGSGGTVITGGTANTGGSVASGGSSPITGGSIATGGAPTGGSSSSSGGASVGSGGAPPLTGGSPNVSGGSAGSDVGGASGEGGDGSAGDSGLGGTRTTGGSASGGSGGSATGGLATGGSATGGSATGGFATGGFTTGGASGGTGGTGPQVLSGSQSVAAFKSLHCESVSFPTPFTAKESDILVQATAVHPASTLTHGALAVWVQSISATGFDVCMTEEGLNSSHRESRLDWLAYVAPSAPNLSGAAGRFALGAVKGRSCQVVAFPAAFAAAPQLQITPNHVGAGKAPNDATSVWVEEVSPSDFRLCAEELIGADGNLDGTNVDWLAYPATIASDGFSAGERAVTTFTGTRCVDIATGCANCENVQLSVNHRRRTEPTTTSHDATLVWAENLTAAGVLTACVSQTSMYRAPHDAHLSIDWLARKKND